MIGLVVKYVVQEGEADRFAELCERMAPLVRAHEPGCVTWQVWRSQDDGSVFHIHEIYTDGAALDAHRATDHFAQIVMGEMRPLATHREATLCDLVATTDG